MTGFGQVHPLPGIWDSFHINTAVTLPIDVEAPAPPAPCAHGHPQALQCQPGPAASPGGPRSARCCSAWQAKLPITCSHGPEPTGPAQVAAAQLTAAGQRITRRALRQAGLQGSNADLGRIAQILKPRQRRLLLR